MTTLFGAELECNGAAGDAMAVFKGIYIKYQHEPSWWEYTLLEVFKSCEY